MRKKVLVIAICLMLALSLVMLSACNKEQQPDPENQTSPKDSLTEGLLIKNSDFKVPSTGDLPLAPNSWTGSAFSSSAYPTGVIAGIIDTSSELYDKYKSKWNSLTNPGVNGTPSDNRMLMIYMPTADQATSSKDNFGPTAYSYTSASFTIAQNCYYKLIVDVKTVNIQGKSEGDEPGARIYLSSTAYAEFRSIDTKGEWERYEIYIEGSKSQSNTLTLALSLGYYSSTFKNGLTTGYAFFDNVSLERITDTEGGLSAKEQFDAVTVGKQVQKVTYTVPNGEFDYGTAASGASSAYPSLWSLKTGGSSTAYAAPTTYRYNGIVDTTQFETLKTGSKLGTTVYRFIKGSGSEGQPGYVPDSVGSTTTSYALQNPGVPAGSVGTNIYMLSQVYMTAQGIASSSTITVPRGTYQKISVSVYTFDIVGAGVSILLSGFGDEIGFEKITRTLYNKDGEGKEIETYRVGDKFYDDKGIEINSADYVGGSTGGWVTYSFYVKGNQYRDVSFTLELWLGTGDTSQNTEKTIDRYSSATLSSKKDFTTYTSDGTFTKGYVFFDNVKITPVTFAEYNSATGPSIGYASDKDARKVNGEGYKSLKLDLTQGDLLSQGGTSSNFTSYAASPLPYDDGTLGMPSGWTTEFDNDEKTIIETVYIGSSLKAGVVNTTNNALFENLGIKNPKTPFNIGTNNVLMITSSSNSLYYFKSNSFLLKRNTCYRISIWVKTVDIPEGAGVTISLYDGDELLKSSSVINTKDYTNEFTNDWVEYTFVIKGYNDKDITASLKLQYGSGNRWTSTTLATGTAYFANVSCVEIPYSSYSQLSSSTTYNTPINYEQTESDQTIFNRSFNYIDVQKTKGMVDGELKNDVGSPRNWTITSTLYEDKVKAGVIKFNTYDNEDKDIRFNVAANSQIATLQADYSKLSGKLGSTTSSIYDGWALNGGPSALMIANVDTTAKKYAVGFKSDSFTLNAGTYYKISVWAYSIGNTTYSIYLQSENPSTNYFGAPYFVLDNYARTSAGANAVERVWTQYVYYIEVGMNSVNASLSLWLGTNKSVTDEVLSDGIAIFDSIGCEKIEKAEFDAVKSGNNETRKISYLSDGFDSAAQNAESKSTLTKPSGWTGNVDGSLSASKTKTGIYYYSGTGADYEVGDLFGEDIDEDLDEDKKREAEERKNAELIPYEQLAPRSGNYALAINNTVKSAYYYQGKSFTLDSEKFYRITVYVKTYGIEGSSVGAGVELIMADIAETDRVFKNINTNSWTAYSFYIKTSDIDMTDVYLTLRLGENLDSETEDGLVKGYALFDDVTIETITEAEYDALASLEEEARPSTVKVIEAPSSDESVVKPGEGNNETVPYQPNLTYLWWMVPTILIAVAIIAVLIAVIVKKLRKPKQKVESVVSKDEKPSEAIEIKNKDYEDKFKE